MKKTIYVRGPVTTESGYGQHARMILRCLFEKYSQHNIIIAPTNWGSTPWNLGSKNNDTFIDKIYQYCMPLTSRPDVSIQIQLPNEWDPTIANVNIGVTAAIETDRCNPKWIDACNKMSAIIVPSQHAKQSLTNTGNITTKIFVVGESYPDELLTQTYDDSLLKLDLKSDFNFLLVGQLTAMNAVDDRKNLFNTIKWICEEFSDNENVGIVIKTNTAKNTKSDRDNVIAVLNKLVTEIKRGTYPKINLMHGLLTNNEMTCLYKHPKIKALVSLTRGEGFGLPLLEAAVAGLPVITTGWSAHTEFLNRGKYISVNYSLEEISNSRIDENLFMKGSRWACVDEADFKKKVQKFYQQTSMPLEWAKNLSTILASNYSSTEITSQLDVIINQYI